ncbi:unnamed protein product [Allacma fusca]|uniref:Uncharacterized protein n=1 Tax=Allacma fusca TaxID=39272 RepID=A0A8J2JKV6_9HEXA|nr:unnamed protein product [Allacma fusca]
MYTRRETCVLKGNGKINRELLSGSCEQILGHHEASNWRHCLPPSRPKQHSTSIQKRYCWKWLDNWFSQKASDTFTANWYTYKFSKDNRNLETGEWGPNKHTFDADFIDEDSDADDLPPGSPPESPPDSPPESPPDSPPESPLATSERSLIEPSVITLYRPSDSPSTIVGNIQTSHVEPIEPCSSPLINISFNLPCSSKMNREIGTSPQNLSFSKKRQISERRSLVPMYDSSSSDSENLDTAGEMILLEEEILPRILTASSEIVGETDVVEAILLPQDKPDKISQRVNYLEKNSSLPRIETIIPLI